MDPVLTVPADNYVTMPSTANTTTSTAFIMLMQDIARRRAQEQPIWAPEEPEFEIEFDEEEEF